MPLPRQHWRMPHKTSFRLRFLAHLIVTASSLDNLQLGLPVLCKVVLPLVPQPKQLLHVLLMHLIHIRRVRLRLLLHPDRPADDNVERTAVRQQADVVVEDAARVEQRNGEAEEALDEQLELVSTLR